MLSFNRQRSIVHTGGQPRHALSGETVTVVTYPDHRVELLHGEEVPPFKVLDPDRTVTAPDFLSLRIVPVITFAHNQRDSATFAGFLLKFPCYFVCLVMHQEHARESRAALPEWLRSLRHQGSAPHQ